MQGRSSQPVQHVIVATPPITALLRPPHTAWDRVRLKPGFPSIIQAKVNIDHGVLPSGANQRTSKVIYTLFASVKPTSYLSDHLAPIPYLYEKTVFLTNLISG